MGLLADAPWFEAHGYSRSLRPHYVAAGWLEQPSRGVYKRPGGKLVWQQVVISLQTLMGRCLHVGGRTALDLHGFTHYVPVDGPVDIHLYGQRSLPGWTGKLPLDTRFIFHKADTLFEASMSDDADTVFGVTHLPWGSPERTLVLSTPERAVLEMLADVPQRETFHQADMLMAGLATLSPRRLQVLLEGCRSVKVKRLFLWFAERHGFRFMNRIDRKPIDLGHGKRLLAKGGKLDRAYLITVPEDLHGGA